jgi:hypothetical protein
MTDDQTPREHPTGEPAPKPSPSAAAARRARRIGGSPAGRPRPGTPAEPAAMSRQPAEPAAVPEQPAGVAAPVDVRPAPPAWLNWAPAGVLSVGAVLMAILIAAFSHGVWWGPDPSSPPSNPDVRREQVLAAAKTCLAATNSYEYTRLDAYEQKALACATGPFVGQLRKTIDSLVKVNAPKLKSSQTAQINRGGIEAISPDGGQWTILLFGQLTVTNTNEPKGRTDPFAAQVRMQKAHGKWLIAGLTTVSSPV